MNSFPKNSKFVLAVRIVLGGIFIYTGYVKIQNPQAFADSVASFQVLPHFLINVLAMGLPPFEIFMGSLLLVGYQKRTCSLAVLIMALVFAAAFIQALARGLQVDCGCFGSGGKPTLLKTWLGLGQDLLIFAGAFLIYLREVQKTALEK